ncbi:hypothetical protein FY036_06495 [Mesorhizobium microcysteis]|uniref:Uncharacterized protein n=1 Tax=Neoaquamicrobium microcysteis TaxID=2682781 RepID=A0A5D4GXW4_9HYPH|nr:hypothetical protein [Mesorhizobium microcysteis]TYR33701.1 hypothetical protein FY036_06495 [Mesorhizobium microcysteis]
MNYQEMRNRPKAASRDSLNETYLAARDMEIRNLVSRIKNLAGRDVSPEFLAEVAQALAEDALSSSSKAGEYSKPKSPEEDMGERASRATARRAQELLDEEAEREARRAPSHERHIWGPGA